MGLGAVSLILRRRK
ncbi:hypothetical protein [Rubritalea tangerina]